MLSKTMPIVLNQNFTKFSAIFIAYLIWYFIASFQWITYSFDIPVCFYQTHNHFIQAPETIRITITGPRKYMPYLNKKSLAYNIDLSSYQSGEHQIILEESNLFLPEPLKLIELYPTIITITIDESANS
ncbi:hypothetical protein KAZ82_02735 [Candidatus Babeliales bacterium]|nr:hypothetical protein [Candidatus Babeliales bacterium]